MRISIIIILISSCLTVHANDGAFYASGGTLIPLKETSIQLKKEILTLTRSGQYMQVDIYFEFYNPSGPKELTVGFVTPPATGDVNDVEESHPHVFNFKVMLDNALLPFK